MKSLINTKTLCKQLKKDRSIIWKREGSTHYITNRMYMVRFEELPADVMTTLFGRFLQIPDDGETLHSINGEVSVPKNGLNFTSVYQPGNAVIEGRVTSYIKNLDKSQARVIKFNDRFAVVNDEYFKLSEEKNQVFITSDSLMAPMYFANKQLLILPFRIAEESDPIDEIIQNFGI